MPSAVGNYAVTFDVSAANGWNSVSGLSAGTLTIGNATPVASDYDFGNLTQIAGNITAVTIEPKEGKSTGAVTVYYNNSTVLPTEVGTYAVTFNVAAVTNWNPATGLSAGDLIIGSRSNQTPTDDDYDISNLIQTYGSVSAVTVTSKDGKSPGMVTVKYNHSATIPSDAGTYTVTFDVEAADGWNAASGLSAGILTVNAKVTTLAIDPIPAQTYTGNAITPNITVKDGSTTLTHTTDYTVSYSGNTNAGTATITVNGAGNYAGSTGGRTFTISNATPVAGDYDIGNLTQTFGNITAVTISPKTGKSSGTRTIYYEGTGGTAYARSTTLPTAAGTYTVTFNVAAATNWNSATGLNAGTLAINTPAVTAVNIAAIQGLAVPTTGGTPVTAITENAQYNGTVSWSPAVSGAFAASNQYIATITLSPKSGYTLQGVTANFFTVAGATATNAVNSGVITAVFPATDAVLPATEYTVTNLSEWNDVLDLIRGDRGNTVHLNNKSYIITIIGNVGIPGSTTTSSQTFNFIKGLSVTIKGNGKLYLTSEGFLINIYNNQSVIIDSENLILEGLKAGQNGSTVNNTRALVYVDSGGMFELRNGIIKNNTSTSTEGGGVWCSGNSTINITGGEISGNTAGRGDGVYISSGYLTMQGEAKISDNTARSVGGGVYINQGNSNFSGYFTMQGNSMVSDNAAELGGGVYVGGTFVMKDNAMISRNISLGDGANGGGVYVERGVFIMQNNATISGNTCRTQSGFGGGVHVSKNGTFRIAGGTIYGYSSTDTNSNIVRALTSSIKTDNGAAWYCAGSGEYGSFNGDEWVSAGFLALSRDNTYKR